MFLREGRGSIFIIQVNQLEAAFSSLFNITRINVAERRQHTINTSHSALKLTLSQSKDPTKSSLFPTAVARSQPPCISPWNRDGATLETNESPIGLKNSSAMVRT